MINALQTLQVSLARGWPKSGHGHSSSNNANTPLYNIPLSFPNHLSILLDILHIQQRRIINLRMVPWL
eukprot:8970628-Ditylum_brightwellii.AAC.1